MTARGKIEQFKPEEKFSTGNLNQIDTQQSERANQSSVPATQPQHYPLQKRTPNKVFVRTCDSFNLLFIFVD